jgi:hypothetical protein
MRIPTTKRLAAIGAVALLTLAARGDDARPGEDWPDR